MALETRTSEKLPSTPSTGAAQAQDVSEDTEATLQCVPAEDKATPEATSQGGVGWEIRGSDGKSWGIVYAEERKHWKMLDGRIAKKYAQGKQWFWASNSGKDASELVPFGPWPRSYALVRLQRTEEAAPPPGLELAQKKKSKGNAGHRRSMSKPHKISTVDRIGFYVQGPQGHKWGKVDAEDERFWHLDSGHSVKKSGEGRHWRWAPPPLGEESAVAEAFALKPKAKDGSCWERFPALLIIGSLDWLPLKPAIACLAVSRHWNAALLGRLPLVLPEPQVDALLQFCLLQVLVDFDDNRLPLPISAVYGEMRMAARALMSNVEARKRCEATVLQPLGRSCRTQQDRLLQMLRLGGNRPYHIAWTADVRRSSFDSLQKLAKHFHKTGLIEVVQQRWRKDGHTNPNTRTCQELMLTSVSRSHNLFREHASWAAQAGHDLLP